MNSDAFTVHDWLVMMAFVGIEQKDRDKVASLARFMEQQRIDAIEADRRDDETLRHNGHDVGVSDASCEACQPIPVPA